MRILALDGVYRIYGLIRLIGLIGSRVLGLRAYYTGFGVWGLWLLPRFLTNTAFSVRCCC